MEGIKIDINTNEDVIKTMTLFYEFIEPMYRHLSEGLCVGGKLLEYNVIESRNKMSEMMKFLEECINNNKYTEDLAKKRIKKGGGLPPIIMGLSKEKQEEVRMVLNEQWLDGYKTAKKKFKNKG